MYRAKRPAWFDWSLNCDAVVQCDRNEFYGSRGERGTKKSETGVHGLEKDIWLEVILFGESDLQ